MAYEKKYEHKPGHGSAFVNREKQEDWHAEFRGDVMLPDGTLHYLDVNPATTRSGDPYYKVKIGGVKVAKDSAPSGHSQAKANGYQPQPAGLDDEIPF